MLDISTTAAEFINLIGPYLPALTGFRTQLAEQATSVAKDAAGTAARALSETAWERLRRLWERISAPSDGKPPIGPATQDVIAAPEDPDALAALRLQLRKLLQQEPDLAEEVAGWLESVRTESVSAHGDRSVAIGGDVRESLIITGDQARVNSPNSNSVGRGRTRGD
ncbi:MAG TPA: hypothetical protein VF647_00295 [Longimicrobium sp.]|jgi:hypothetical protein